MNCLLSFKLYCCLDEQSCWFFPLEISVNSIQFFFFNFIYLFGCSGSQLQHVGSSSLTRDQTWAPCAGSSESQLLDHQGSPCPWNSSGKSSGVGNPTTPPQFSDTIKIQLLLRKLRHTGVGVVFGNSLQNFSQLLYTFEIFHNQMLGEIVLGLLKLKMLPSYVILLFGWKL